MTTITDKPWLPLAARALAAQRRGDRQVAARLVERIAAEHDALVPAMVAWIDTLLVDGFGVTEFTPQGAGVIFGDVDSDEFAFADGSQPPEVVWGGRLFAARAAGDEEAFNALIVAATSGDATPATWAAHVLRLLDCCALTLNDVKGETA